MCVCVTVFCGIIMSNKVFILFCLKFVVFVLLYRIWMKTHCSRFRTFIWGKKIHCSFYIHIFMITVTDLFSFSETWSKLYNYVHGVHSRPRPAKHFSTEQKENNHQSHRNPTTSVNSSVGFFFSLFIHLFLELSGGEMLIMWLRFFLFLSLYFTIFFKPKLNFKLKVFQFFNFFYFFF